MISPKNAQTRIDKRIAAHMLSDRFRVSPITTEVSASIEPMDKSIPPAQMTNTMPSASTPLTDTCWRILITFPPVRNVGDATHIKPIIISKMIKIPYFFIKVLEGIPSIIFSSFFSFTICPILPYSPPNSFVRIVSWVSCPLKTSLLFTVPLILPSW